MAQRTIVGTVYKSDGTAWSGGIVYFELVKAFVTDNEVFPVNTVTITLDSNGQFTEQISVPTTPSTALYKITLPDNKEYYINLTSGDEVNLQTLLTLATTEVESDDLQLLLDANTITVENSDTITLALTDRVLSAELSAFPADLVPVASTFRAYRAASFTFSAINTWTDIPMDTKVELGVTENFSFFDEGEVTEDKSIFVASQHGVYLIGGYISPDWTGGDNETPVVAIRVIQSVDNGETWIEDVNVQALTQKARGGGEFDTMNYFGSIHVLEGEWIKLQVLVSDVAMLLEGSSVFTTPISATITLYGIH